MTDTCPPNTVNRRVYEALVFSGIVLCRNVLECDAFVTRFLAEMGQCYDVPARVNLVEVEGAEVAVP